jgi:hypothetical protein
MARSSRPARHGGRHGEGSLLCAFIRATAGFHPSPAGSYLAALVIHAMLYGRPPLARENLDYGTGRVRVTSAEARIFEDAAAEAIEQHGLK